VTVGYVYSLDRVADRVPIYAPDGGRVGFCDARQARYLVDSGRARPLGTRERIRSLRLLHPPPRTQRFRRRPQYGDAHRRETYYNPRGTWTLDFLPSSTHSIFAQVLTDVLHEP